ncbi:MAG: GTPase Era [Bacilli bacterium]|nr:GTPase Era [Bacilli bacterium]
MKSGFVAIIGRPNVGKSTLLNSILHKKISIVTSKAQTTRNSIQGIFNSDDAQIIFIDTPGIHKPGNELSTFMNKSAFSSLRDVEAMILLIDSSVEFGEGDKYLISKLGKSKVPMFLVFNKIDLTNLGLIESLKSHYKEAFPAAQVIEISALNDVNVDKLLKEVVNVLPEGPQYFPIGTYTDHPESFIISEIIREKILGLLRDEVPHSIAVIIEQMKHNKNECEIDATIICEREGQKGIIIGRNGKMIKRIGMQARYDIENLLGIHCSLKTFVRVEADWRNSPKYLKEFGYKINSNE